MRVMNEIDPALLASPPPLAQESCFSWVQRICGAHQLSLRVVQTIVTGTGSSPIDWDRRGSDEDWEALVQLSGTGVAACAEARGCLSYLAQVGIVGRRSRYKLLHHGQRPASRWCPACFEHDAVPHLRWEWRLPGVTRCLHHGCALRERCPWCDGALRLDRSLLVDSCLQCGVETLAQCASCGMSLAEQSSDPLYLSSLDDEVPSDMLDLVRHMRTAFDGESAQLQLDLELVERIGKLAAFVRHPIKRAPDQAHAPVSLDLWVRRVPDPALAPLRITAESFRSAGALHNRPATDKAHWSKTIIGRDRARLAAALRLIRKHKAARQTEQNLPPVSDGV